MTNDSLLFSLIRAQSSGKWDTASFTVPVNSQSLPVLAGHESIEEKKKSKLSDEPREYSYRKYTIFISFNLSYLLKWPIIITAL